MSSTSTDRIFTLENAAGLRIRVLDYGATWDSCLVPLPDGSHREVLLGCANAEDYRRQTAYLGSTVGRYANRIANARFTLDGKEYVLDANEGTNQLHGGSHGFDSRTWTVVSHSPRELVLSLVSEDGDQGFPGRMETTVRYTLGDDLSLSIGFEATVSAPCPVNLTNHVYFNLNGDGGDCRDHQLRIDADAFLPTTDQMVPIGELRPVAGTGFDFREPHRIGERLGLDPEQKRTRGYDHSYWLNASCADGTRPAAEVESGDGKLRMELYTRMSNVQLYTGNLLAGTPKREGGTYATYAGLALEPQFAPDSPNRPEWPDCVLRPGQRFQQVLRYRFVPTDAA